MGEEFSDGVSADDRYIMVNGRRWRRQDPSLPSDVAADLRSQLGSGRSAVGKAKQAGADPAPFRRRVSLAKHGLGERGTPWWEQSAADRRERWEHALRELAALDEN